MLAYVFWHRGSGDPAAYEDALRRFHAALAAEPPPGFERSAAFRLSEAPWLPGDGDAYEDWYLVADWTAVGELNAGAISGSRRDPHDAVAAGARAGAGAIYRLIDGAPSGAGARALWTHRRPAEGASVWQRQMVLGPAPEWCALGPAGEIARTQVA